MLLNKAVWNAVNERSGGLCEECQAPYPTKHHAFGGANRAKLEMPETVFDLCYTHHQQSPTGVHYNKKLAMKYKQIATQNLLDIGWSEERIIQEVGKWYGK